MRILRLPEAPKAILFDIDSTLYTNPEYAAFQNDVLIRELAQSRGESVERARAAIRDARTEISARTGKATSLGNALAEVGVDMPTNVVWRERLIRPGEWLSRDEKLVAVLSLLAKDYLLAAVTNNPGSVGLESLRVLGIAPFFRVVVGLDDTMISKPAREPFELASRRLEMPLPSCISIGDRYDVDIAVPLELGMGAILVDGVEDVYSLPGVLSRSGQV